MKAWSPSWWPILIYWRTLRRPDTSRPWQVGCPTSQTSACSTCTNSCSFASMFRRSIPPKSGPPSGSLLRKYPSRGEYAMIRTRLYAWTASVAGAVSASIITYFIYLRKEPLTLTFILILVAAGVVAVAQVAFVIWSSYRRQQVSDRIYRPIVPDIASTFDQEPDAPG